MQEPESTTASLTLPPTNNAGAQEEIRERADTVWTRGPGAAPAVPKVATNGLRGPGALVEVITDPLLT